ncbi:MAG: DUF1840 domain-containing protein [Lautropia sp.]|nr:DUF1840 domain-containing protein [Lautropia sp.]
MLFEFRSRATGTVTMTHQNGKEILSIIGKSADSTGIITVAQIPGAIAALKTAAAHEKEPPPPSDRDEDDDDTPREPFVSLKQRTLPLIELLERARAADVDVTWGV